jgi:hypothetical protein
MRRLAILLHRYLGIPLSFLFVLWFASGIVMMYTGGMPELSRAERLERLPALRLEQVRLSAAEAAAKAGAGGAVTLTTVLGRPAYRIGEAPFLATVFADDGTLLEPLDDETARGVAAEFGGTPLERVRRLGTVADADQWTLLLRHELPLEKYAADDGAGTELYVSRETAAVVLATTRASRALAWAGAIPHWFYVTPLRINQPLWYWSVVATALLGCALAVLGLVLAVVQFRRTRPFDLAASIRYTGWMRWHYILGALVGVFTLTWAFSGMLSMEPLDWTATEELPLDREAFLGTPLDLNEFAALDAAAWARLGGGRALKEIELASILGAPHYLAHVAGERPPASPPPLVIDARTIAPRGQPFAPKALLAALAAQLPSTRVTEHAVLEEYDDYYYARGRAAPLPALRVKLDDPASTWLYFDLQTGALLGEATFRRRVERWIYHGLHSLDFAFWYDRRPLWDIGVIALSVAALVMCSIGLVLGVRRARRDVARLLRRRPSATG